MSATAGAGSKGAGSGDEGSSGAGPAGAGAPPRLALPPDAPLALWWQAVRQAIEPLGVVELWVPDPDRGPRADAQAGIGSLLEDAHGRFRYRPWRVWVDLAEALGGRLGTPHAVGGGSTAFRIERLEAPAPLPPSTLPVAADAAAPPDGAPTPLEAPPEAPTAVAPPDPYGEGGAFGRLHKLEDAATLTALVEAIGRADLRPGQRVLVLGAHRGDELEALTLAGAPPPEALEVVAVERSPSTVASARRRWPGARWIEGDVAQLGGWGLGRFELVLAIGLLQSPAVDRHALLRTIAKTCLADRATLVVGLPNSRLVAGDLLWGARTRNVGPVEMGLVVRDAAAVRRFLQQQRFRVFVTGKYDLLVTGVRR